MSNTKLTQEEIKLYNQQQEELHNIFDQMKYELESKNKLKKEEALEIFLGKYGLLNRLMSLVFNPTFRKLHEKVTQENKRVEAVQGE